MDEVGYATPEQAGWITSDNSGRLTVSFSLHYDDTDDDAGPTSLRAARVYKTHTYRVGRDEFYTQPPPRDFTFCDGD